MDMSDEVWHVVWIGMSAYAYSYELVPGDRRTFTFSQADPWLEAGIRGVVSSLADAEYIVRGVRDCALEVDRARLSCERTMTVEHFGFALI